MQKAKGPERTFGTRARYNAREIVLALALTFGAALFMMTAFSPATPPNGNAPGQARP